MLPLLLLLLLLLLLPLLLLPLLLLPYLHVRLRPSLAGFPLSLFVTKEAHATPQSFQFNETQGLSSRRCCCCCGG